MKHIILIVKESKLVADYWSLVFAGAGHEAIICLPDEKTILKAILVHSPTVLFIEARVTNNQGIGIARQSKQAHPALRCVVCLPVEAHFYTEALQTDLSGYLPNDIQEPAVVIECLDQISQGCRYIHDGFKRAFHLPLVQNSELVLLLSDRQKLVLRLIAEGNTSKQIALQIGLAVSTVDKHKEKMSKTLGLDGVYQLKIFAGTVAYQLK